MSIHDGDNRRTRRGWAAFSVARLNPLFNAISLAVSGSMERLV